MVKRCELNIELGGGSDSERMTGGNGAGCKHPSEGISTIAGAGTCRCKRGWAGDVVWGNITFPLVFPAVLPVIFSRFGIVWVVGDYGGCEL